MSKHGVTLAVLLLLQACGPPQEGAGELRLGTASLGGAYYPLGQSISSLVIKYSDGVRMVPVVTAGSPQNPRLLASGDIEAGLTNADLAYFAHAGLPPYQQPIGIRALGVLHPSILHLVTLADSELKRLEDIRGKRVAVGPANGGTLAYLELLLAEYGMTLNDFNPSYLSYSDGFSQLADGNVDASFALIGMPGAAITQLRVRHSIKFLEIDQEIIGRLMDKYSYYRTIPVAREVYDTAEPSLALGVSNLLIVRADMAAETAYQITAAIFDHLEEFSAANVNAAQIDPAASRETSIPLHPGAARYFEASSPSPGAD